VKQEVWVEDKVDEVIAKKSKIDTEYTLTINTSVNITKNKFADVLLQGTSPRSSTLRSRTLTTTILDTRIIIIKNKHAKKFVMRSRSKKIAAKVSVQGAGLRSSTWRSRTLETSNIKNKTDEVVARDKFEEPDV
jgi:hypothetical protein